MTGASLPIGAHSPARRRLGLVLVVALSGLSCTPPVAVYHLMKTAPVVASSGLSLTVLAPKDKRPAVEHKGLRPNLTYVVPLVLIWWLGRQGSWVTSGSQTQGLVKQLPQGLATTLKRSGAFETTQVQGPSDAATDFYLESEILHLYGTHYDQAHRFGSVFSLGRAPKPAPLGGAVYFGAHGNVVLRVRLWDARSGTRVAVWDRVVRATATVAPGRDGEKAACNAASAAMSRVLASLAHHVAVSVQDLTTEGSVAFYQLQLTNQLDKGKLSFVVERTSAERRYSEILTVEHVSGRVTDHRIVVNHATPIGPPHQWMLSRRRPNNTWMPYAEYSALANILARDYDLRRVDEIYHYHFFGKRAGSRPDWD